MTDLALALRAGLLVRCDALDPAHVPREQFVDSLALFEAADDAYRQAIRATLRNDAAQSIIAEARAFRIALAAIRERAHAEIAPIYARAGRAYGDHDPLDTVAPSTAGLAHVDSVRVADCSDRARDDAARLRERANGRILPLLRPEDITTLIEAKRTRIVAFRGAIHAAAMPLLLGVAAKPSDIVESLATLADGWY